MADSKLTVADNPNAPEVFASGIQGAGFDSPGVVRMTFVSNRPTHDTTGASQVIPTVNLRLVMSVDSARAMVGFLNGFLSSAELNAAQKAPDTPMQ